MRKRATETEKIERLEAACTLLDQGHSPAQTARALAHRFGIEIRQAFRYVKDASQERAKTLGNTPPEELDSDLYHKTLYIHRRLQQEGKFTDSLKALDLARQIKKDCNPEKYSHDHRQSPINIEHALDKLLQSTDSSEPLP